jgi:hypothetical protein
MHYAMSSGASESLPPVWLDPGENSLRPHSEIEIECSPHEGHDARLEFTDAAGNAWVRIASTGRLYEYSPGLKWWQDAYQTAAKLPILDRFLTGWPQTYALWKAKKTSRIPVTARWLRFWWGYMPSSEPSPWDMPNDWETPGDWPYESFLTMARYQSRQERLNNPGI